MLMQLYVIEITIGGQVPKKVAADEGSKGIFTVFWLAPSSRGGKRKSNVPRRVKMQTQKLQC